jgi:hypothetical protein
MSSINYCAHKPALPLVGDAYLDNENSMLNIFDGNRWVPLHDGYSEHPDLKIYRLQNELQTIKDYLKYKNVDTNDLDDFIISKQVLNKLAGE